MFIFLYRLTGGDDHADQRGKACLKCFCDTFDSDRCMNSLTRGWMSMCIVGPWYYELPKCKSFVQSPNSIKIQRGNSQHIHVTNYVHFWSRRFEVNPCVSRPLWRYKDTYAFEGRNDLSKLPLLCPPSRRSNLSKLQKRLLAGAAHCI